MKTYITSIFDRIKNYAKKLDDQALLTDKHWVVFSEDQKNKIVYIFQKTGTLLIVINGKITKSKWEYLGNNSLLIDVGQDSYLFKQGFIDNNILALKVDGLKEYAILLDEDKIDKQFLNLKSLEDFLQNLYIINKVENICYNQQQYIKVENDEFRIVDDFQENFAVIIDNELNYGFINENREIVKKCVYDFAENFSCGLALVRQQDKFGFIDKSFDYAIKPIYERAKSFSNNQAEVIYNKKVIMINIEGNEIIK